MKSGAFLKTNFFNKSHFASLSPSTFILKKKSGRYLHSVCRARNKKRLRRAAASDRPSRWANPFALLSIRLVFCVTSVALNTNSGEHGCISQPLPLPSPLLSSPAGEKKTKGKRSFLAPNSRNFLTREARKGQKELRLKSKNRASNQRSNLAQQRRPQMTFGNARGNE